MEYFISYVWYTSRQSGHGMTAMKLSYPIQSLEDIKLFKKHLDETIKDKYGELVDSIIMNYKELNPLILPSDDRPQGVI